MTNENSIAFKYARALLLAAKDLDTLDEVGKDAANILSTLKKTPELDSFLRNPAALEKETSKTIRLLFYDTVSDTMKRFLELLEKNRRVPLLTIILERFTRFLEEEKGVVRARLEYAGHLTPESKNKIISALNESQRCELLLEEVERPDLIGGVRLTAKGKLYDNSTLVSIKRIRETMLEKALNSNL